MGFSEGIAVPVSAPAPTGAPPSVAALGIEDARLVFGEIELAPSEFQVFVRGVRTHLTRREFQVLHALVLSAGHVVLRERLYENVWGRPMPSGSRSVDVYVQRLRVLLAEASPDWKYIHTHFGFGYRFDPERVD